MNIFKQYILLTFAAMSICIIAASCKHDEFDMLPDNERFLKFTAMVDGMVTRADDNSFWDNDDRIRVRIDDYHWTGQYSLNSDGSVKEAIDALAWPYTDGYVSAWYPVPEDAYVSISDQSEGYHKFDFLSAKTERKMNYKEIVNLNFKHLMAKVSCKLIKGDGITEEDLKTAKIRYYGIPTVKFSEEGIEGKGSPTYITPASDFSALLVPQDVSGQPFITVDLTLTINDARIPKTLVYTPHETMNLVAGKAYTFKIKVQKDRLEVETISGAWTESLENTVPTSDRYRIYLTEDTGELGDLKFSSNVTEKSTDTRAGSVRCLEVLGDEFTISYKVTADNCHLGIVYDNEKTGNKLNKVKRTYYEKLNSENTLDNPSDDSFDGYNEFTYTIVSPIVNSVYLKKGEHIEVGDILFQDGTWGGIPKKIYDGVKKPVGIVFKVGAGGATKNALDVPSNYGWNASREIRGYAVALTDAPGNRIKWGPGTTLDSFYAYNDENKEIIKYSGIIATNKAKSKGIINYPAFEAAIEYTTAAPPGSSDWYLPSYSQLHDVYNLFLHPQRRQLLTDAGGDLFQEKYSYCTTTERSASTIWIQCFLYNTSSPIDANTNSSSQYTKTKTNKFFVRSVLTF